MQNWQGSIVSCWWCLDHRQWRLKHWMWHK